MAYNITNAIADFENIALDEFGESIKYTPYGSSQKTILAIIYRTKIDQMKMSLKRSNTQPARNRIEMKISQGATNGVANVTKGRDTVTFKIESDDTNEKTLVVQSANQEYGTWRLGLM